MLCSVAAFGHAITMSYLVWNDPYFVLMMNKEFCSWFLQHRKPVLFRDLRCISCYTSLFPLIKEDKNGLRDRNATFSFILPLF